MEQVCFLPNHGICSLARAARLRRGEAKVTQHSNPLACGRLHGDAHNHAGIGVTGAAGPLGVKPEPADAC